MYQILPITVRLLSIYQILPISIRLLSMYQILPISVRLLYIYQILPISVRLLSIYEILPISVRLLSIYEILPISISFPVHRNVKGPVSSFGIDLKGMCISSASLERTSHQPKIEKSSIKTEIFRLLSEIS